MANSRFASLGRYAAVLVAASLLATVSLDAAAYGDRGAVRLQLGTTYNGLHMPDRFVYQAPGGALGSAQPFSYANKGCTLVFSKQGTPLVDLTAIGPGSTNPGQLGLGPTSIGVYDGPQGTACYRVSAAQGEALDLALDSGLNTAAFGNANAFDRLELDIEVKQDAAIRLDIYVLGKVVRSYYLRSGGSVVAGQGTTGESGPQNTIFNCNAESDSGPDAGPLDNCRWIVNDLGQSFTLTATAGQFSLEGGGDYVGDEYNHESVIWLTSVVQGTLDCSGSTPTVEDTTSQQSCTVTRHDASGSCTSVSYILRADGSSCEFITDSNSQMVANLFVQYPPEPAPAGTLPTSGWSPAGLSRVSFGDDPSGQTYLIPPCLGVTLKGQAPPYSVGSTGPDPIPEIAAGTYDWVSGNSSIDYACAFQRTETYFGTPPALQNYIQEGIQFWGDIAFSRN